MTGIDVYAGEVPQEAALPALLFNVVSVTYLGVSHDGAGLTRRRVQISGIHPELAVASNVRGAAFKALNNFWGIMGGGLDIQSCLPVGGRDLKDERTGWYLAQQDWNIEYQESE
jgi:hypothetical protein